jgi:hypothetical protein
VSEEGHARIVRTEAVKGTSFPLSHTAVRR